MGLLDGLQPFLDEIERRRRQQPMDMMNRFRTPSFVPEDKTLMNRELGQNPSEGQPLSFEDFIKQHPTATTPPFLPPEQAEMLRVMVAKGENPFAGMQNPQNKQAPPATPPLTPPQRPQPWDPGQFDYHPEWRASGNPAPRGIDTGETQAGGQTGARREGDTLPEYTPRDKAEILRGLPGYPEPFDADAYRRERMKKESYVEKHKDPSAPMIGGPTITVPNPKHKGWKAGLGHGLKAGLAGFLKGVSDRYQAGQGRADWRDLLGAGAGGGVTAGVLGGIKPKWADEYLDEIFVRPGIDREVAKQIVADKIRRDQANDQMEYIKKGVGIATDIAKSDREDFDTKRQRFEAETGRIRARTDETKASQEKKTDRWDTAGPVYWEKDKGPGSAQPIPGYHTGTGITGRAIVPGTPEYDRVYKVFETQVAGKYPPDAEVQLWMDNDPGGIEKKLADAVGPAQAKIIADLRTGKVTGWGSLDTPVRTEYENAYKAAEKKLRDEKLRAVLLRNAAEAQRLTDEYIQNMNGTLPAPQRGTQAPSTGPAPATPTPTASTSGVSTSTAPRPVSSVSLTPPKPAGTAAATTKKKRRKFSSYSGYKPKG